MMFLGAKAWSLRAGWRAASALSRACMTRNSKLSCAMRSRTRRRGSSARLSRIGVNARSTRASCGSPARSAASAYMRFCAMIVSMSRARSSGVCAVESGELLLGAREMPFQSAFIGGRVGRGGRDCVQSAARCGRSQRRPARLPDERDDRSRRGGRQPAM